MNNELEHMYGMTNGSTTTTTGTTPPPPPLEQIANLHNQLTSVGLTQARTN